MADDLNVGACQAGAGMDVDVSSTVAVPLGDQAASVSAAAGEAEAVESGTSDQQDNQKAEAEVKLPSLEDVTPPSADLPPASTQNSLCSSAIREAVIANTAYYCLPALWLRGWQMFADGRSGSPPGMIDMAPLISLITPDMVLVKRELASGQDYEIIPESVWKRFVQWYGVKGPEVKRIASEGTHRLASVVLHPLTMPLTLFKYPDTVATATGTASITHGEKKEYETFYGFSSEKVKDVKATIAQKLKVDPSTLRLWDFYSPHQLALLPEERTLSEANIVENNGILVEFEHPYGKKFLFEGPRSLGVGSSTYSGSSYNYNNYQQQQQPRAVIPGKQGLGNLGNTCFMNSGLQCLSACVPLTDFFLSQQFVRDINRDNPIGAKGLMAEAYGKLLGELWSSVQAAPSYGGGYYYSHYHHGVEPRQLKGVIERFAPQFSGYQQQDSQELLAFLLDGLHEDLNRIIRKPYVEGVTGTPDDRDEEIAEKAWDGHKKRNNSVIVDHFQGQLKSKVVCPHCSNVSITFDPFMYLSLPLPIDTSRWVKVVYVPIGDLPTRHAIALKSTDSIATLFQLLTAQLNDMNTQRFQRSSSIGNISTEAAQEQDEHTSASGAAAAARNTSSSQQHQQHHHVALTPENTVLCELNYGAFYERKKHTDLIDSLEARETYYVYEMHTPVEGGPSSNSAATAASAAEARTNETNPFALEMDGIQSYPPRDDDHHRAANNSATLSGDGDDDDDDDIQMGDWAYLPTTVTYAETYGYSNYVTYSKAPMPLVISTPNRCTYKELYERIRIHLEPYCRQSLPGYDRVMADYHAAAQDYELKVAAEKKEREEALLARQKQEAEAATVEAANVTIGQDDMEAASTPSQNPTTAEEDAEDEIDEVEGRGRGDRSPASSSDEDNACRLRRSYDDSDSDDDLRYTHSAAYRHASVHHTHYNHYGGSDASSLHGFNRNPTYASRASSSLPPPSSVPPIAPPNFPFSITVTERYKSARIISPLTEGVLRFGSADDVSYSIAFPSKNIYLNYIDEGLMRTLEEHRSVAAQARASMGHNSAESPLPLKDCLDLFCTEEQLTEENMWYCNKCRDHVRAIKKLELWSLPRILVVHLKRFHYASRNRRDKISTLVEFPLENLDLSSYLLGHLEGRYDPSEQAQGTTTQTADSTDTATAGDISDSLPPPPQLQQPAQAMYDLFAVSNHYGGMGGGHYTAFAKHRDDGGWFYYDDSSVRTATVADVQSPAAYVLFYHRKDVPWPNFDSTMIGSAATQNDANSPPTPSPGSVILHNGAMSLIGGAGGDSDEDEDEAKDTDSDNDASSPRAGAGAGATPTQYVRIGSRIYPKNDTDEEDETRARSSDDEDDEEAGFRRDLRDEDAGSSDDNNIAREDLLLEPTSAAPDASRMVIDEQEP